MSLPSNSARSTLDELQRRASVRTAARLARSKRHNSEMKAAVQSLFNTPQRDNNVAKRVELLESLAGGLGSKKCQTYYQALLDTAGADVSEDEALLKPMRVGHKVLVLKKRSDIPLVAKALAVQLLDNWVQKGASRKHRRALASGSASNVTGCVMFCSLRTIIHIRICLCLAADVQLSLSAFDKSLQHEDGYAVCACIDALNSFISFERDPGSAVPQTSLDNSVNFPHWHHLCLFHRLECAAMCAAFSAVGG